MTPRRTLGLAGALVLLCALAARLSRAFAVFQGEELVPLDGDSLRHLLRMEAAARDGLRVPAFDPWVNWPHGAFEPWAPGFDVVGAVLMLPFGPDTTTGKLAACLLPVLLGVGLVALVAAAAWRLDCGPWTAWVAALVTAFSPQLVVSSMFGRTDHHVWEACTLLGLAAWVLALSRPGARPGLRAELAGAALVFLTLWGFDGGPLYVALITGALVLGVLARPGPALLGSGALALALGGLASAGAYLPVMLQHQQAWTFKRPSLLQPALVEVAALAVALAVLASARAGPSLARRLVALGGAGAVALLAAAAVAPLRQEVLAGLGEWLGRSDPWLAAVSEFEPMLASPAGFTRLRSTFGLWAWTTPALFPLGLVLLARARGVRGLQWGLLSAATAGLALFEMRFGRVAIPFVALTCLAGLELLAARLPPPWATALVPALALAAVALDGRARDFLVMKSPEGQKPIVELSVALRTLEPEHRGLGVLASWDDGHYLEGLGRHPVLVNGFGSYASPEGFLAAERAWSGTPEALEALFRERRLGWWVEGVQNYLARAERKESLFVERDGRRTLDARQVRAWPLAATLFGGSGDPRRRVPHLEHLWPRAASTAASLDVGGVTLPDLWLFERVEGAVVEGAARPGSLVVATLQLGARFPYTAWTVADPAGRFSLRLPIPSGARAPGLETGPWSLVVDGVAAPLEVTEAQVREGDRLPR